MQTHQLFILERDHGVGLSIGIAELDFVDTWRPVCNDRTYLSANQSLIGQVLNKGDDASLQTANAVMLDIYHLLNLARDAASGAVVDKLATARAVADKIGAPSDHVDEAKTLLLQFITASAPLVDEAASEAGSTTTVTS